MKHAIKVCCSAARRFGLWLCLLGMVALALAWSLSGQPSGFRLTHADRLQTVTQGYQPPDPVVDPDRIAGSWAPVTLPHSTPAQWSPGYQAPDTSLLTWYRLHVPPPGREGEPLYLFVPNWKAMGTLAIYADGALIYQSHANLQWNGANQPRWIALPHTSQSKAPRQLLVRVQHSLQSGEGLSSVWIGTHEQLYPRYVRLNLIQTQLSAIGSSAFLATGLFALMVWWTRRSEPIYVLFFVMSASCFLSAMNSYVGQNRLLVPDAWFGWLTVNSALWMLVSMHLFLAQLHGVRQTGLTRALLLAGVCMGLITMPPLAGLTNSEPLNILFYLVIVILAVGVLASGLWHSIRQRSRDGMLLAGWGIVIALSGFADLLMQSSLIGMENVFLTKHASVGVVLVFWYIMFHRYTEALRAETASKDLVTQKLREREAELAESYQRLRNVEREQMLNQERQRLMQDMHDGLGSSLRTALWAVEKGRTDEHAIADVLKSCIDDLKLAIDSMEPVQADLLLLLATWRFRLEPRIEDTGIALHWEVTDLPALDWLEPKSALHILRIMQEALTNVIKHARATEIRVRTGVEDNWVVVSITDNGIGFSMAEAFQGGGKGLTNLSHRAQAIGAEVSWSRADAGTCFALRLPVSLDREIGPRNQERNQEPEADVGAPSIPTVQKPRERGVESGEQNLFDAAMLEPRP